MKNRSFHSNATTALILLTQILYIVPAHAAADFTLVKAQGSPAVYWVTGTARRPFPLYAIYKSWFGDSFSGVKEITLSELSTYTLSKNVLFKKESLIKIQTDPKVYRVADDAGKLEWIQTEDEFLKRGLSFKNIVDVPDAFFPDYTVAPASDFATPQNPPPTTPMASSTPIVVEEKPVPVLFALSGLSTTNSKNEIGAQVTLAFTTNEPATATIEYTIGDNTSSTVSVQTTATAFSKTAPVQYGSPYRYLITATNAAGKTAQSYGTFISYSDIQVSGLSAAVAVNKPLAQSGNLVGGFVVQNGTKETRTTTQFTLRFDSAPTATTNVAKTIQLVRLNTDNSVGDVVVEKTVGSGTSILNMTNLQKLASSDEIAPGQQKRYGIVIKNLENMNLENILPTDVFVTYIAAIDFLGDTMVSYSNSKLGTLTYRKP